MTPPVTTPVRRGLLTLLCLWVGFGVSLAPYRPAAPVPATAHTTYHAGHTPDEPTGTHPHGPRCVVCVVGAGTLPALVRVSKGVRLERAEPPLLLPGVRPRPFRLFRSRAPPLTNEKFNLP